MYRCSISIKSKHKRKDTMGENTEEYPLGGTIEPYDIEREKELMNEDE